MVVGGGMIATAFSKFDSDDRVLIFASGVSNSLESDPAAFAREKRLLLEVGGEHTDKLFVYFGTCSVCDPDRRATPYVEHKLEMESIVAQTLPHWMIIRLPLAVGPAHHATTLASAFHDRISTGQSFEVWQGATRYPIDVADAVRIVGRFVSDNGMWNKKINVALRSFPVLEFVREIEKIVGQPGNYKLVPKGRDYEIPTPEVLSVAREMGLDYGDHYLRRVLRKYYSNA